MTDLVLSLFPGIGLLDRAFEEAGFCVVRGPDTLWGGDIRAFSPPASHFVGVIGGPPCQDFSSLRRISPTGYGEKMLIEFARCVTLANPEWWLLENVARVPDVTQLSHEYTNELGRKWVTQRLDINQGWYCDVTRLRHIQFGSQSGRLLNVTPLSVTGAKQGAAVANDDRKFAELCRLQGLPDGFDLPPFLVSEKKKAVGNGVPLVMGRVLAQAVIDAYRGDVTSQATQLTLAGAVTRTDVCACGCGRPVTDRQNYYGPSCRKRAQRKRDRAAESHYAQSR